MMSKRRIVQAKSAFLTLLMGVVALAWPLAADGSLVSPGADLLGGAARRHPDPNLPLVGAAFNVYTATDMPPAWTLLDAMSGVPGMGTMDVIVYSQVWEHDDGHLLFAYQIENNSTAPVRSGNIAGFDAMAFAIIDCGVFDLAGTEAFDEGDVLQLSRPTGGNPQLAFAFKAPNNEGQMVERLLAPGETSSWFYAETDALDFVTGPSTVMDGGQSADMMEVFVPAPEPATTGLLAAGMAAMLLRRRRDTTVLQRIT
ncbi:MAG: PEP-CTERM sorting domain-containing protein [Phycisphaerae bacterium]|nr:PEP-CTERM sorting domain-containing protein [Phycisphaerae bacterium]